MKPKKAFRYAVILLLICLAIYTAYHVYNYLAPYILTLLYGEIQVTKCAIQPATFKSGEMATIIMEIENKGVETHQIFIEIAAAKPVAQTLNISSEITTKVDSQWYTYLYEIPPKRKLTLKIPFTYTLPEGFIKAVCLIKISVHAETKTVYQNVLTFEVHR